jgi:hypothetical protein
MIIAVIYIVTLLLVSLTNANLAIHNEVNGEVKTYPSAVFRYFSNNEDETLENYEVVFLEGETACSPRRDVVSGKIIVANFEVGAMINCWPIQAANSCALHGAVAFVVISFYNPPGLESNIHWTFNPNAESIGIPYVEVAAVDIGDADLVLWRNTIQL